jgi:sensor histidine kinase YesM
MEKSFVKKNTNPLNWKTALIISVSIVLILSVLRASLITAEEQPDVFLVKETADLLQRGATMLLFSTTALFLLFMLAFKIIQFRLKPHIKAVAVILGVFLAAAAAAVVSFFMLSTLREIEISETMILLQSVTHFIAAVMIWLITAQIYSNYLRQQAELENEQLIAENIRNRYEALKNQIDPHFLFNSLNTLNGLIGFDNDRAHKYVEKLSSVFRYTIQNKEITTLQDEMDFTNSYAYLIKIRYGDNFNIETDISEQYLSYSIMPISVQLLIENAIKHNVISAKYPLTVRIYTTESDILVVENNIRAKISSTASGIGLANLSERYKLLFHKEVAISNMDNIFRVEIPLIN